MTYEITSKMILGKIFERGWFNKKLIEGIQDTSAIVEREEKSQAPVDKGTLRSAVRTFKNAEGYVVKTTAGSSHNPPYPYYVHEGTYDYRGDSRDYGVKGIGQSRFNRTAGKYGYKIIKSKKGIRPNKFSIRARKEAEPKVIKEVIKLINFLSKV